MRNLEKRIKNLSVSKKIFLTMKFQLRLERLAKAALFWFAL
jgi:hypothetical protein